MQIPSIEAVDAVKEYTSDLKEQHSLMICLSELPIGDEYGILTEDDMKNWNGFFEFLSGRNIEAWCNYTQKSDEWKTADSFYREECRVIETALKIEAASAQ